MLVGAFTAVAVSYFTGSWLLGIIAAMIAGAVIAMIMAVGHIRYNSEICAIGMGINLLALALTKFMVNAIFHSTGSFSSPDIKAIPRVSLGFLDNLPVVGDLFNNWCVTEWFAIVLIILLQFFFYKTVWGLPSACGGTVSGSSQDGRYQGKCNQISGDAAFWSHRWSGRCTSFPGIQYPVYREHDQ